MLTEREFFASPCRNFFSLFSSMNGIKGHVKASQSDLSPDFDCATPPQIIIVAMGISAMSLTKVSRHGSVTFIKSPLGLVVKKSSSSLCSFSGSSKIREILISHLPQSAQCSMLTRIKRETLCLHVNCITKIIFLHQATVTCVTCDVTEKNLLKVTH